MNVPFLGKGTYEALISLILVSILGGCGGVAPTGKMAKLDASITSAREAEAISYAPLELKFAEDKFNKAQKAVEEEEYNRANRLADEALLDARLAEEKALSAKAQKEAQEMRESIDTLRREVQRKLEQQ